MRGKDPKCIITNQCVTISKALRLSWNTIPHRMCMWHIMNKLSSKVGPSFASDKKFMTSFKSVVYGDHLSVNEFEEGWNRVMEEYKLQYNTWLQEIYSVRSYWIPMYFNDIPMVGLLRTTSRYSELIPTLHTPLAIEKDDATVYTKNLFNFVSEEITNSLHFTKIDDMVSVNGIKSLKVMDKLLKDRIFEVFITLSDNEVQCPCKFFDRTWYLCRNAFAALIQCDVVQIPRQFLMTRWIKKVEFVCEVLESDEVFEHCAKIYRVKVKVNELNFDFQICINYAGLDEDKIDKIRGHVKLMKEDVQDLENGSSDKLSENV
ncbi:hypothetical protein POM88_005974 [Heracleum sosnowskyi]|uniref:Protein FAR1-RELATED SEQUENCE n=1 Tax=Heracleum sosnowskyi TaxID=360622 RepID=A0AAD8J2K2_9APIA|nr:hypothetical protein POM88_005974 [Heracleum sosnowskyi]